MAFVKEGENEQPKKAAQPEQAAPVTGGGNIGGNNGNGGNGFRRKQFNRSFNRGQTTEVVAEFVEVAEEHIKHAAQTSALAWSIVPVDARMNNMHYSLVAMVGSVRVSGTNYAAIHSMILDGSNVAPRGETFRQAGLEVELIRTAEDAWDAKTYQNVCAEVQKKLGNDVVCINTGCQVIPDQVKAADSDIIRNLLWVASEAIHTVLDMRFPSDAEYYEIADLNPAEQEPVVQFQYNAGYAQDLNGLPLRSDITLNLHTVERKANQIQSQVASSFQHEEGRDIAEVNMYPDIVYAPQGNPQMMAVTGQPQSTVIYQGRMVITRVMTNDIPFTLESYFLALSQASLVADNWSWAAGFFEQAGTPHDIGGIGMRAYVPENPDMSYKAFDTTSATLGSPELMSLLARYVAPTLGFSIDCQRAGPDSWLTGLMVDVAMGPNSPDYAGSRKAIIDSLDRLTGNRFSTKFAELGGQELFLYEGKVDNGTYVNGKGETADIRDIDTRAVLNAWANGTLEAADADNFETTFSANGQTSDIALSVRRKYIRALTKGSLKIRGTSDRITITGKAMQALVLSVKEAGLLVRTEGMRAMFGQQVMPGHAWMAQQGLASGLASGMVAMGNTQQFNGFQRGMVSRW